MFELVFAGLCAIVLLIALCLNWRATAKLIAAEMMVQDSAKSARCYRCGDPCFTCSAIENADQADRWSKPKTWTPHREGNA